MKNSKKSTINGDPLDPAFILVLLLVTFSISANATDFVPGKANFEADSVLVFFPAGITGIVFDTSKCENCRSTFPEWRYIGDLKIDSIMHIDTTVPFTTPAQIENVQISSPELRQLLLTSNAYRIEKFFPWAIPHDTLFWDSIRVKWHVHKDCSLYYIISFDEGISADSIMILLQQVPALRNPSPIPIPLE